MRIEQLGPLDGGKWLVYSEILEKGEVVDADEQVKPLYNKLLQEEAIALLRLRDEVKWQQMVLSALTLGSAAEMQRLYSIHKNPWTNHE